MASLKKNILLNGIGTASGFLFPLVTFPYAARVLLPDGIGAVNFLYSIVNYIILLTSLGIPLYAIKEVAKCRDNPEKLNKVTLEILALSFILCLGGYIIVWLLAQFVPQIHAQMALFFVLSLAILFTGIGVEWFYKGIEDFQFITIRGIIIKTLSAACLFIFVKSPEDLVIYGLVTVGSTVGNNMLNFIHLRKYIRLELVKLMDLDIFRHLKPALHIFILNLIISLYIQLNSIMLGFMAGDVEVGYFTAGTKITHIGLTLIGSIGSVLLPRCSNLLSTGQHEEFARVINKSLSFTIALSLPMIVGLSVLATPITLLFCGEEFIDSIPILYLNAPVILVIGLTNVLGIQILYPMGKINLVIISSAGAAIANIVLNLLLIPNGGAVGAAIATLVAETAVLVIQVILGYRYFPFKIKEISILRYIMASLLMGAVCFGVILVFSSIVLQVVAGVAIGAAVYFMFLLLMKDRLALDVLKFIRRK